MQRFLGFVEGRFSAEKRVRSETDCHAMIIVRDLQLAVSRQQTSPWSEQTALVERLHDTWSTQQSSTVLLAAARGRGKSAAIGIALSALLKNSPRPINLCAPSRRATGVIFKHLNLSSTLRERIRYIPPEAITESTDNDVLIVDEAGSLPLARLDEATQRYRHCLFVGTTVGYEGAGRGLLLRLLPHLQQRCDNVSVETLQHPVRWLADDPLEHFLDQAFLLDSGYSQADGPLQLDGSPGSARGQYVTAQAIEPTIIQPSQQQLCDDPQLLNAIYALLAHAHYRTRPRDLQYLLDAEALQVFVMNYQNTAVGVALLAHEGPITDDALATAIMHKRRRPVGDVLPQLFAQYTMQRQALNLRIARIVRIALTPSWQRHGFGSRFLQHLKQYYADAGFDAIGAMFSSDAGIANFWQNNQFIVIHKGYRRQATSGQPALSVIYSLSDKGTPVFKAASHLHEDRRRFDAGQAPATQANLPLHDKNILKLFSQGSRSFHDSQTAITRWIQTTDLNSTDLSCLERELLMSCSSSRNTIGKLKQEFGVRLARQALPGAERTLRQLIHRLALT